MANDIAQVVDVVITTESNPLTIAGYGTPLILGAHTKNTDRIRFYTSLDGMEDDGFTDADPEYKAAQQMLSQDRRIARWAVGRRTNRPTMRWALTPTAANGGTYKVRVGSQVASFTADSSATVAEIITGLASAVAGLTTPGVTGSDQTTYFRLTADAAGAFVDVEVPADSAPIKVAQDNADAGIAADLSAIEATDGSWYVLLTPFVSHAEVLAAAAWVNARTKLYVVQTQDSDTANTVASGATDIMAALAAASYRRTAPIYHPAAGAFIDSAWSGRTLTFDPGSETWALQQLSGAAPVALTETQRTNIEAKNGNHFTRVAGANITREGKVSSGEFIDSIRGQDWLTTHIQERIFLAKLRRVQTQGKVPYTDAGIAVLETELRAALGEAVARGFIRDDWTVTVPKAADASTLDRSARVLNALDFDANLQGAIHKTKVRGRLHA